MLFCLSFKLGACLITSYLRDNSAWGVAKFSFGGTSNITSSFGRAHSTACFWPQHRVPTLKMEFDTKTRKSPPINTNSALLSRPARPGLTIKALCLCWRGCQAMPKLTNPPNISTRLHIRQEDIRIHLRFGKMACYSSEMFLTYYPASA